MGNITWIKGGPSPNPGGRPKNGDHLTRLNRWSKRRGTERELDRIYDALPTAKDKLEMHKAVWFYIYVRPAADSVTPEELHATHDKLGDLLEENRRLKKQLDELRKTG